MPLHCMYFDKLVQYGHFEETLSGWLPAVTGTFPWWSGHVTAGLICPAKMSTVAMTLPELDEAIRHAKFLQQHLEFEAAQSTSAAKEVATTLLTTLTSWRQLRGVRLRLAMKCGFIAFLSR